MMVMTAKVDKKKLMFFLLAVLVLICAIVFSARRPSPAEPTSAVAAMTNDSRVAFLNSLGWQVVTAPRESCQVSIPKESTPVYERYNNLQKEQGYDLSRYAGKNVMRYVYEIRNYPDAAAPVYATLLVYKGEIIGGDITNTASRGGVQSLRKANTSAASGTESTASTQ